MGANITLWIRAQHNESADAQAFLRSHRYAADRVRTLPGEAPSTAEFAALAKGLGGELWPLIDARHPRYGELLPRGAEDVNDDDLLALLKAHPDLLKAPLLLTPRGALAGFREQKWRAFLDIGQGR